MKAHMIRMKPTETPASINEKAINPEWVAALKGARRSGPVLILTNSKHGWDQDTGLSPIVARGHAVGR